MLIVVSATCLLTISVLRTYLVEQLDDDMDDNRNAISAMLFGGDTQADSMAFSRYYGILMDTSGDRLTTMSSFNQPGAPQLGQMTLEEVASHEEPFSVPNVEEGGQPWRVAVYSLESGRGSVAVALSLEDTNEVVDQAAKLILRFGLIVTALAVGVAYLAVTRSFRPLDRVEKTAAVIAAGDLSQRVNIGNPQTEIGRLSRSLNTMLAHIESAFASRSASENKMRRFVADASHELRTPLVTIRGFSELYRHGALETEEDVSTAMSRIENEAKRMGEMVEDLLMLARIDEQRPLQMDPVDLLVLAQDAAVDAQASDPDRRIKVIALDGGAPPSAPTAGDEARLRQVMANLLTNAMRYTPPGSPIEIAVGVERVIDDRLNAIIEVRDHGPGISEDDAARVFERFYRADTSRTRETGGTGLGLAIVAAIVAQHDGTVRINDTAGGGATLSLRLPFVPADAEVFSG